MSPLWSPAYQTSSGLSELSAFTAPCKAALITLTSFPLPLTSEGWGEEDMLFWVNSHSPWSTLILLLSCFFTWPHTPELPWPPIFYFITCTPSSTFRNHRTQCSLLLWYGSQLTFSTIFVLSCPLSHGHYAILAFVLLTFLGYNFYSKSWDRDS